MELRHLIEFAKFSPLGAAGVLGGLICAWPTCTGPSYDFIANRALPATCTNHFGSFRLTDLLGNVLWPPIAGGLLGCIAALILVYAFHASKDELLKG